MEDPRHKECMTSFSDYIRTLKLCRRVGVKFVKIIVSKDSCENCKKTEGKYYRLDKVPKLPNPRCTNESAASVFICQVLSTVVANQSNVHLKCTK